MNQQILVLIHQANMPVFIENASSWRDFRVLPSFSPALPRLRPEFAPPKDETERYEVVIVGVCGRDTVQVMTYHY